MKVYIVTDGCYSDYHIEAVFSARELADAYIAAKRFKSDCSIEEYGVDSEAGKTLQTLFYVSISIDTGEVSKRYTFEEMEQPNYRGEATEIPPLNCVRGRAQTPELALKLAAEKQQEILRQNT